MNIDIHCDNINRPFIVMNAMMIRESIVNVNLEKENIITFTFNKEENAENFCCQIYDLIKITTEKNKKKISVTRDDTILRFKIY